MLAQAARMDWEAMMWICLGKGENANGVSLRCYVNTRLILRPFWWPAGWRIARRG
jgi:hypothetical protein